LNEGIVPPRKVFHVHAELADAVFVVLKRKGARPSEWSRPETTSRQGMAAKQQEEVSRGKTTSCC
jgi:hypothetical protein